MRVQTTRWVAGCAAAVSVALIASALLLAYADRHRLPADLTGWNFSDVFDGVANLAVPVVGFVLASRRPANRVGWAFLVAGLGLGLGGFARVYGLHALVAAPGSWPAGRAAMWLANWIWVIPIAMLAFVFLLFPTGQLRSRRWRPAAWFVGGTFALTTVGLLVNASRLWADPFGATGTPGIPPPLLAVLIILVPSALVVSVAAVVVRFVRSRGEERLQLKWFAAASLLVAVTFIPSFLTNWVVAAVLSSLAFLCLWVAIGIAVLKYRLYEIDIVISKAVLYGSLAVFITAVYAGLVVGVGALAGGKDSPLLAALAAAVVAVAVQPASGPGGWPTASCTAGGPLRIRCCPTSPSASVAHIHTRMSCPRWHRSWRPGPALSGSSCGCGWMTSSARRPPPTAAPRPRRCPSRTRRCCPCPART